MSQNSPTLLPSRETGASPSCLVQPSEKIKHGSNLILIVWFRCFIETRNVHICLQGTAINLPIGRSHRNTVPVKPQILNLLHSQQR